MELQEFPVELLADIFALLDIADAIAISQVSKLFRFICQDALLNPWKPIIAYILTYRLDQLSQLRTICEHSIVPRQNFIDILTLAPPGFLLMEATLPALKRAQWDEATNRRFLPSWRNVRHSEPKEQFLRNLWNVWHRSNTNCTTSESWTKYVWLSRSGRVHESAAYSRSYQPTAVYQDLQAQSDLSHLQVEVRVVLQLADVRILALGVLHRPNSFFANKYARMLLHPPGVNSIQIPAEEPEEADAHDLEEAAEATEDATDLLSELQPTLSRESTYSTSSRTGALSFLRGRSWSNTPGPSSQPASRGISIFRTRSLDEQNASRSSPPSATSMNLFQRLARSSKHKSPERLPTTLQTTLPTASSPPMTPPMSPTSPVTASSRRASKAPKILSQHPTLRHPTPSADFSKYPNFTPGGADARWKGFGDMEEDGRVWAGPMLLTAQIVGNQNVSAGLDPEALLTLGRFASFGVEDLWAIAPWMKEKLDRPLDGPGLGNL